MTAATTARYDVAQLRAVLLSGSADVVQVLGETLSRLAADDTGAVLRPIAGAMAAAADSQRRYRAGQARPLEGIAFAVKDIIDVADTMVTCGSLQTGERIATRDATVVARLRAAGAIPIAMTATTEYACGSPENRRYGTVKNPWDHSRWTGGSSTGSAAAVANRLVPFALGTDTGGSVRIPAAWCGVTGLKPTQGLVPREGVACLSWTLDHVGPLAQSAADIAAVLPVLSGQPLSAAADVDIAGVRIGSVGGWFAATCEPDALQAWQDGLEVLRAAGATIVPIELGDLTAWHLQAYAIVYSELAVLQARAPFELFDPGTQQRIERGRSVLAVDYLQAQADRTAAVAHLLAAMAEVDVLLTPGTTSTAPAPGEALRRVSGDSKTMHAEHARTTMFFDYTGVPALMLPAGHSRADGGLPLAVQVVGRPGADELCLRVGSSFQQLTDYHRVAPASVPPASELTASVPPASMIDHPGREGTLC